MAVTAHASAEYVIDGDTVYEDFGPVILNVSKHTLSSSGYVYFNAESVTYTGQFDAVWGFNTSVARPSQPQLYNPHWENSTSQHSHVFYNVSSFDPYSGDELDYGNSYNTNYSYTAVHEVPIYNETTMEIEGYEWVTSNASFDSFENNDGNYTISWHNRHDKFVYWTDIAHKFGVTAYDYQDFDTWYYVTDIDAVAGQSFLVRAWVDVPVSLDRQYGKYYFGVKPSAETIPQAIASGHFYVIDPWWNASWSYYKTLTINQSMVNQSIGTGRFPVLVSLTDSDLADHAQADGDDIVFTNAANTTQLPHELEYWNQSTGVLVAWVGVDDIKNVSYINMYYNNPGATDTQNSSGVWDDNYIMVQHLQETDIDGGAGDIKDSTQYGNDGTTYGMDFTDQINGKIDGAFDFDGVDDEINCGSSLLGIEGNMTVSSWVSVKIDVNTRILAKHGTDDYGWMCGRYSTTDALEFRLSTTGSNWVGGRTSSNSFLVSNWYYITVTYDNSSMRTYINGDEDTTGDFPVAISGNVNENILSSLYISRDGYGGHQNGTNAEVRLSNINRSSAYIQTDYNTTAYPDLFLSVGEEQSIGPPTIELISMTPSVLYDNSTGLLNITYGISHTANGLNNTSLSFIYRTYDHVLNDSNHSFYPPDNDRAAEWLLGRILRGNNRNNSLNFEDNDTITGGDIYTWSGLDENNTRVSIVPVNSTYTYVYINGTVHDLMSQTWYIDRSELQQAQKTPFAIHKTQGMLFKFWVPEIAKGNQDFISYGYADALLDSNPGLQPTEANLVDFYYLNDSYNPSTDGDPLNSPYAIYLGSMNATEWQVNDYAPHINASYVRRAINVSILSQAIETTNISYLYFISNTPSGKPYYMNITNDPTSTNVSFADTNVLWSVSGDTVTQQAYTPNFFFANVKPNMSFDHRLFIADNNGLWNSSSINETYILSGQFPPGKSNFEDFHLPGDVFDENMNGTYNGTFGIHILTAGDPDGGKVTFNLTLHYANGTFVDIINNTFTSEDVCEGGDHLHVHIDFNSTPYYLQTDQYTLRVIGTDDENQTATTWLGVNFSLDGSALIISYSPDTPVTSIVNQNQTFSITMSQTGNVTWYLDGTEVSNQTNTNTSSYSNLTAPVGNYNVTVVTSNEYGNNSFTWDWTVILPTENRMPLSIFIMWSVVMFIGMIISLLSTGLFGIVSSLVTSIIAYINSKAIINGTVVQYFAGVSSADTIITGTRSIESLPLSYVFLFIAMMMALVFVIHTANEIMYQLSPDMEDEFFDE